MPYPNSARCWAYNDDGSVCGAPAVDVDPQRGCTVCAKHRSPKIPPAPRRYSVAFDQTEYERGWRAGWHAALAGNFQRLRVVEARFADGLNDPDDQGFLDAWNRAEDLDLVPDNPSDAAASNGQHIIPA